jgi:hypothetical protein
MAHMANPTMTTLMGDDWAASIKGDLKGQAPDTGNRCFNCNEPGHTHHNCTKDVICKLCRTEGHKAQDCPTAPYCYYCLMTGHTERRCRRKEQGEPRRQTPYGKPRGAGPTGNGPAQIDRQTGELGAISKKGKEDNRDPGDIRPVTGIWDAKERLKAALKQQGSGHSADWGRTS